MWEGTGRRDNEGDGGKKNYKIMNDKNALIVEKVSRGSSSVRDVLGMVSQK